jgi:hypothetical protein
MASLTWKPADDRLIEVARVVVAGNREYTFEPGIAKQVPSADYATAKAALQALQGNIATAGAPTVAAQGVPGLVTWGYKIAAVGQTGDGLLSPEGTTATGNATLTSGNNCLVTRPALPTHATGWRVVRTTSGGIPVGVNVDVSGVLPATQATFTDTGIAGTAYSPAGSNPPVDLVVDGPADL